jgi:hypothetical protein
VVWLESDAVIAFAARVLVTARTTAGTLGMDGAAPVVRYVRGLLHERQYTHLLRFVCKSSLATASASLALSPCKPTLSALLRHRPTPLQQNTRSRTRRKARLSTCLARATNPALTHVVAASLVPGAPTTISAVLNMATAKTTAAIPECLGAGPDANLGSGNALSDPPPSAPSLHAPRRRFLRLQHPHRIQSEMPCAPELCHAPLWLSVPACRPNPR